MSDDGQRTQETAEDFGQTVTDQPYRSEFDEAIVRRDRFMSWQSDRMRGRACTEEQIEAMARKALDMPYAFWIQALPPPRRYRGPFGRSRRWLVAFVMRSWCTCR